MGGSVGVRIRAVALLVGTAGLLLISLLAASSAQASTVTLRTVVVGKPGNPALGIVPFTDAAYQSCNGVPAGQTGPCMEIGNVDYQYEIGDLEVTVSQWVTFLNTVDPHGVNRHRLYNDTESGRVWSRFGQITHRSNARPGKHYSVSYPEWANKPYGFATFPRAARFANSLFNGRVLSRRVTTVGAFRYIDHRVRLSSETERGMYDFTRNRAKGTVRGKKRGFVIPSQDEWVKAAYYDPNGGGTYSYWKYPTNAGVFGDNTATQPNQVTLNAKTGDVTNSATQPLANFHNSAQAAPTWCPAAVSSTDCATKNPFGLDQQAYDKIYQGSLGTVGQAKTLSPWGTHDQGGNAVEWTDTITPPPFGKTGPRVWRRLHGGVPNSTAYQMWPSAVGLQPEQNTFYNLTYPWIGFRIGVIG